MTATLLSPAPSQRPDWSEADYGYGVSESARQLQRQASEARQHFEQPLSYRAPGIHERFRALADRWHEETDYLSGTAVFMHPAYQQIIGMGPAALPLLLRDLAETESHWFWALRVITNENPVPPEHRGRIDRMVSAWLSWGMRNHLL